MAKADDIDRIVSSLNRKRGKGTAVRLGDAVPTSEVKEALPTPLSVVNNYVLGPGGLPVGRVVELLAEEGTGKTSFALGCLATAQAAGAIAIYCETEKRIIKSRMKAFGINTKDLILLEPDHFEEMLELINITIDSLPGDRPTLFVLDTLAATPTKAEWEEGVIGKPKVAERARLMSRCCRVLAGRALDNRLAVLIVNQMRDKVGVLFGKKQDSPGGHALKYLATARLQLLYGPSIKRNGLHVGKDVTIMGIKSVLVPPWRKTVARLMFDTGWDETWSMLNYAKNLDMAADNAKGLAAYKAARAKLEAANWVPQAKKTKKKASKK